MSAHVDARHRMREVDTILSMVARGTGISIRPRLALPDEIPDDVVALPLAPPTARAFLLVAPTRASARDHHRAPA